MSEVKVNKISPRTNCGTVQLGDSGDTITIPAGATITNNGTQTGFGRTGTVDWDTTAKTASFTAVSGNGYFVNTTSGVITVTLPAGSAGDIVSLKDYAGTWNTNKVTVTPNGTDKINGFNENTLLDTEGQSVTLIYVDSTKGWQDIHDSTSNITGATYITATGGTITCCGDYKIHTFTGPGTFTVCSVGNPAGSNSVDYIVVAGGGSGSSSPNANIGGGGGAGGYREGYNPGSYCASPLATTALPVTVTGYPITVGGGGAGNSASTAFGNDGSNSVFSTITSAGGGGASNPACGSPGGGGGRPGGSGGGSAGGGPIPCGGKVGGTGNTPTVSPPQGNDGGDAGFASPDQVSAGGGGATAAGGDAAPPTNTTGNGGAGATTSISGSPTAYAGGGGGAAGPGKSEGTGGTGGGGPGGYPYPGAGTAGTTNTGGGGGGGGAAASGAGGSGIVIIRYKYQ